MPAFTDGTGHGQHAWDRAGRGVTHVVLWKAYLLDACGGDSGRRPGGTPASRRGPSVPSLGGLDEEHRGSTLQPAFVLLATV